MAVSLKRNRWFFVTNQTPCPQLGDFLLQVFFLENYKSITKFLATLFHGKCYVLILAKNGLGYALGHFFINSSGRPGCFPRYVDLLGDINTSCYR
jgi:hypothetical protein